MEASEVIKAPQVTTGSILEGPDFGGFWVVSPLQTGENLSALQAEYVHPADGDIKRNSLWKVTKRVEERFNIEE